MFFPLGIDLRTGETDQCSFMFYEFSTKINIAETQRNVCPAARRCLGNIPRAACAEPKTDKDHNWRCHDTCASSDLYKPKSYHLISQCVLSCVLILPGCLVRNVVLTLLEFTLLHGHRTGTSDQLLVKSVCKISLGTILLLLLDQLVCKQPAPVVAVSNKAFFILQYECTLLFSPAPCSS